MNAESGVFRSVFSDGFRKCRILAEQIKVLLAGGQQGSQLGDARKGHAVPHALIDYKRETGFDADDFAGRLKAAVAAVFAAVFCHFLITCLN